METKLLGLVGAITAQNADEIKQQLWAAIGEGGCILDLDLAGVTYMNNSGLTHLIVAGKRARRLGGMVRLYRPQQRVRDLLDMARIESILEVFDCAPQRLHPLVASA